MGDFLFTMAALVRAVFVRVFHVRVLARFAALLFVTLVRLLSVLFGQPEGARGGVPPQLCLLFVVGPPRGLLPPFKGGLGGLYV